MSFTGVEDLDRAISPDGQEIRGLVLLSGPNKGLVATCVAAQAAEQHKKVVFVDIVSAVKNRRDMVLDVWAFTRPKDIFKSLRANAAPDVLVLSGFDRVILPLHSGTPKSVVAYRARYVAKFIAKVKELCPGKLIVATHDNHETSDPFYIGRYPLFAAAMAVRCDDDAIAIVKNRFGPNTTLDRELYQLVWDKVVTVVE